MSRPALFVCSMLAGCAALASFQVGGAPSSRAAPPPPAASPTPARAASAPTTPGHLHANADEPVAACPADFAIDLGKRDLETVEADLVDPGHERKSFAPGHIKPPAKSFALEADDAVTRVIAIETKHPAMIPAGFRDAVAANPRDGKLRARMADCERQHEATLRRSGYDAALALLLGAELRLQVPTADLLVAGQKPSKAQQLYYFISKDQVAIEDALTRGLYGARKHIDTDRLATWGQRYVHLCGAYPCFLRDSTNGFGSFPEWIHWDLRDGGTYVEHKGPTQNELDENVCQQHTGELDLGGCHQHCEVSVASPDRPDCNARCAAWCKPHV